MRTGSCLKVELKNLAFNFNELNKLSPKEIIFMVKANAYGHGLVPISQYCLQENLCSEFGCASIGEALELQKYLEGEYKIWVFSETSIEDPHYSQHYSEKLIPVIHHFSQLEHFLKLKNVPLAFKFNTGMNRLGIEISELEQVIDILKKNNRKNIFHLMSHYSSSYTPNTNRTQKQYEEFSLIEKELRAAGIEIEQSSLANSGAIERGFIQKESHIRPGLMLYGPTSLIPEQSKWQGKILSELRTHFIKVAPIEKGTPVGYGGHVCHENGVLGIIPLGYGDGVLTFYQGAEFQHKEFRAKVLGRVNMDLIQIFLPFNAMGKVQMGDELKLWTHEQQDILSLSSQMRTIPYQLFCALTQRLPRVYQ